MYKYLFTALLLLLALDSRAYTLEEVHSRGYVRCGVSTGSPGFSAVDAQGNWTGFDVDLCRAVAAATLGDSSKVQYQPLSETECFTALLSGEVDILSRHVSWTFTRDTALAANFAGISYYDEQALLSVKSIALDRLGGGKEIKVCSTVGSPYEQTMLFYLTSRKVAHRVVTYESLDLAVKGFDEGTCSLLSLQRSQLEGIRRRLALVEDAVILPDSLGKEAMGPVVRQGDDTWFNIVRWTLYAMINAEELGLSSKNIEEKRISNDLPIQQLLGLAGTSGRSLGLRDDWVLLVIRQVGSYGEIFDKNLGAASPLQLERGLNRLWKDGGLIYAPPYR